MYSLFTHVGTNLCGFLFSVKHKKIFSRMLVTKHFWFPLFSTVWTKTILNKISELKRGPCDNEVNNYLDKIMINKSVAFQ